MRDEIALLPRTPELMMLYEKKYTQATDAIMEHNHQGMVEVRNAERKSIADLQERQRERNARKDPLNWDKYFSICKPENYYVNYLFRKLK